VVESVLVVNPGFLSKRGSANTYAKLTVHPASMTEGERNSKTMLGHKLFERAGVELLKI
jgi:DNA polymerase alpha subunit B